MKHKVYVAIIACLIALSPKAQKFSIINDVLEFESVADYEQIVESDEDAKALFYGKVEALGFSAIKNFPNNTSLPDTLFEDAEFIANILNKDGVTKIGKNYYRIDYGKEKVFILPEQSYSTNYNDLVQGIPGDKVGVYDFDFDVIDMVEEGFLTQPTEEEMNAEGRGIKLCWKGKRAKKDRNKIAMYFRDLSDLESSFGSCVNTYDGRAVTSTRLKIKTEYLTLGIWSRLDIDGKIQKLSDKVGINGWPLWTTQKEDVGERNWDIMYKANFRGRCGNDDEQVYKYQLLPHPISNENKGRKVLWERIRGLRYYCVEILYAEVYTNNAFMGPCNDQAFCAETQNIKFADPAQRIRTFVFPGYEQRVFTINRNLECP